MPEGLTVERRTLEDVFLDLTGTGAARMTALADRSFSPRRAPRRCARMVAAQASLEIRMVLRNGEQLLLTLVIPSDPRGLGASS